MLCVVIEFFCISSEFPPHLDLAEGLLGQALTLDCVGGNPGMSLEFSTDNNLSLLWVVGFTLFLKRLCRFC